MYKTLRKESLKCVLPRIIACAVIAAILLAICAGGLVKLAAGPKDLGLGVHVGDYVSFDASEVIVAFASLTAKGESSSETLETYYLISYQDSNQNRTYLAVMDQKEAHANVLDRAMEQSHEYYLGDLETLTPLGKLSGTVKDMDYEMEQYLTDCLAKYELPDYENPSIYCAQIELDRVGLLSKTWTVVLALGALAFLLLLIAQVAVLMSGAYQKTVRALIGDDESSFASAQQIERIRVADYIWYTKGPGSRALRTEDVIWGYAMPEPMVVSKYRWPVALYTRDQELVRLTFMYRKSCDTFLKAVADQGKPFISGYTSQLAQLFQSDLEGFLREAEKAAKESNT